MSELLNPIGSVPSLLVKVTLVLLVGSIIALLMRQSTSRTRHAIWATSLIGALFVPAFMIVVPSWRLGILPPRAEVAGVMTTPSTAAPLTSEAAKPPRVENPTSITMSEPTFVSRDAQPTRGRRTVPIPFIWLSGVFAILAWITIGRVALRRIASRAEPIDSEGWQRALESERRLAGVTKPVVLLSSDAVSTPVTWGIRTSVILLPVDSAEWAADHRDVVLRHEMAHIARGDSITQLLGTIVCAIYWFHPLVWVAARGMRAEQERACDDHVLSSGTSPVVYAGHLLEVARSARSLGPQGFVSLAMARPSQLEGRLLAVLNASRNRAEVSPLTRKLTLAAAGAAIITLSAFTPVARPAAAIRAAVTPTILAAQFATPRSPIAAAAGKIESITKKRAFDSTFEKSVSVPSNGTLVLDLESGASLTITGWDQSRVAVSGRLGGRDWRETEVTLEQTSTGARLTSKQPGRGSYSTNHHFDIHVPRKFSVRISSAGGGVTISGVDGTFTGTTGGGAIQIENSSGRTQLSTGGGNIKVFHSRMSGSVTTGGGTVYIQDNDGDLDGSSGSGPTVYSGARGGSVTRDDNGSVTISSGANVYVNDKTGEIRDRNGRIIYRKSGGSVYVGQAMSGADIRTGGGAVTIGRSAGDVSVQTGGGRISIGPLSGTAMATTGAGDVIVDLHGSRAPSAEINSGNGRVEISLPKDFSGTLDLETAYTDNLGHRTRIISDWPLPINETTTWEDLHGTPRKFVRARKSFGDSGGVIRVRTVNGDIIIRRE